MEKDISRRFRAESSVVSSDTSKTRLCHRAVLLLAACSLFLALPLLGCWTTILPSFFSALGPFFHWYTGGPISRSKFAICTGNNEQDAGIYTVDGTNSVTECMAVEDGVITFVGTLASLPSTYTSTIIRTPKGSVVIPGMTDSHTHLLPYGSSKLIPLESGTTVQETVQTVREYILSHPEIANNKSKTIEGWGWNHMAWPTKQLPTAADLDADPVIRGRPVVLSSKDGHAYWVSGTTLKANAPFPESHEGGTIIRDNLGNPSGIFMDTAQSLINVPPWSFEDMNARFQVSARDSLAFGLTSLHDAMLWPDWVDFFTSLAESGNLPIRVRGFRYFDPNNPTYWGNISKPISDMANGMYSMRSAKIVSDGAMRSGGAAMKEPYTDRPNEKGSMRVPLETLQKIIPSFLRDGWQVNAHAIGDLANKLVLDVFESALPQYDTSVIRPRIEHAQILSPEDVQRIGKLGLIASIQPSHVISDMWFAEPRIGPERVKGLYAFRDIISGGPRITLGSDMPVDSPNPMVSFYAAITRLGLDGNSPHGHSGWFPNQRLTRLEALRGMTIDPAYASFTDSYLGSLEVGKKADFVVLSADIMKIPPKQILKTKVLATVLDGTVVYGKL